MLKKIVLLAAVLFSISCLAQSNIDETQFLEIDQNGNEIPVQQQKQVNANPPQQTNSNKEDCPDCKRIKELQQQKNQFYSPGFEVKYKNRSFKRKYVRLKRKMSYVFSKPKKSRVNNNCFAWK